MDEQELCGQHVYWWEGEYDGDCELPKGHLEPFHYDGISYFDNDNNNRDYEQENLLKLLAAQRKADNPSNFSNLHTDKMHRLQPAAEQALELVRPELEAQQNDNPDQWQWLYIVLADYSNDLAALKKRDGKLPADAAVARVQERFTDLEERHAAEPNTELRNYTIKAWVKTDDNQQVEMEVVQTSIAEAVIQGFEERCAAEVEAAEKRGRLHILKRIEDADGLFGLDPHYGKPDTGERLSILGQSAWQWIDQEKREAEQLKHLTAGEEPSQPQNGAQQSDQLKKGTGA